MLTGKLQPLLQPLLFYLATHQLMAQHNGGILTLLFITGTDFRPLGIGHQRQADGMRKRTLFKFQRRAGIHHRRVG